MVMYCKLLEGWRWTSIHYRVEAETLRECTIKAFKTPFNNSAATFKTLSKEPSVEINWTCGKVS